MSTNGCRECGGKVYSRKHRNLCPVCYGLYEKTRAQAFVKQWGRCIVKDCMYQAKDPGDLDLHHIIPIRSGGRSTPNNCVLVCKYHHPQIEGLNSIEISELTTDHREWKAWRVGVRTSWGGSETVGQVICCPTCGENAKSFDDPGVFVGEDGNELYFIRIEGKCGAIWESYWMDADGLPISFIGMIEPCQVDYRDYILSERWLDKVTAAKRRAGYRCQVCGSTTKLHGHHVTYARLGKELPDDIQIICSQCHERLHQIGSGDKPVLWEYMDAISWGDLSGVARRVQKEIEQG